MTTLDNKPLAVIGIGSRDLSTAHIDKVWAILNKTPLGSTIFSGGAPGADTIVERWTENQPDVNFVKFEADWKRHGKAAGPIRNRAMVDQAIASFGVENVVVLAFVNKPLLASRGTRNCCLYAIDSGVPVLHEFNVEVDTHYNYVPALGTWMEVK